jgi:hypothetical protein
VLIPLVTLFVKGYSRTSQYKLITFSILAGVTAHLFRKYSISSIYSLWHTENSIASADSSHAPFYTQLLPDSLLVIALGIAGLILGVWLGSNSSFNDGDNGWEFRILARYLLASLFGIMAATGNLHAAFLSILLLVLLYPGNIFDYLKQAYKPVIAISGIAIITSSIVITDLGVIAGIKSLLTFPYPNWITFYAISPGITLLFITAMIYLAGGKKGNDRQDVVLLLVTALFPLILVGIFRKWAAARYMIEAYPFMLILSAYMLHLLISKLFASFRVTRVAPAVITMGLIILSGFLGGHGLIQAYKVGATDHEDYLNKSTFIFRIYPDHKTPGEYVAKHRNPDDIVIAEDALQQRWYAGKVDYWLRGPGSESGGRFTYKGKDLKLHDIYVNSIVLTSDVLSSIENNSTKRIWVITSAETYFARDLNLKEYQLNWLENIESSYKPVYTGRDKITKVYCINCDSLN